MGDTSNNQILEDSYAIHAPLEDIFQNLNSQRQHATLCDVILMCETEEFPAHKCVLAAASDYFKGMFEKDNFTESNQQQIRLHSINKTALKVILDMIYTGKLCLTVSNMHSVLAGVDHLLLNKAKCFCIDFMFKVLALEDYSVEALHIHETARLFSLPYLMAQAELVISKNFAVIIESEDFLLLDLARVQQLISSDTIETLEEYTYFQAVIKWINYAPEQRGSHFDDLMGLVRFPLMDSHRLVVDVKHNELVKCSSLTSTFVQEAMEYKLLSSAQSKNQTPRTRPRCNASSTIIYCLAGVHDFKCYVPKHDTWYSLQAPPVDEKNLSEGCRYHTSLTAVSSFLYACIQTTKQGEVGSFHTQAVLKYSIEKNAWTVCAFPENTGPPCVFLECYGELLACSRNGIFKYFSSTDMWETVSEAKLDPYQFGVCDDRILYFYNLEEGTCQQVFIDQDYKVVKQQIMSPNRFIMEVLDVSKLANHEILVSQRTFTGTTRRIFMKTNLWRDCVLSYGLATLQPRAGVNFPLCFDTSDPWQAVSIPSQHTLYILAKRAPVTDIPVSSQRIEPKKMDGVLPFCKVNLTTRKWTRLASLPERLVSEDIHICVSEGCKTNNQE